MYHDHRHGDSGQIRKNFLPLSGILLFLCLINNTARGDIYMYIDANGTQNFSNIPSDERYVLTMRTEQILQPAKIGLNPDSVISRSHRKKYTAEIMRAAADYHLDPALLHAVIATESGYRANAVSNKGALGLMQLMPEMARHYGVSDPFNPEQNIRAGAQHLNSLLQHFDNDLNLALAAYNSGEENVLKYGGRIPPFFETRAYVPKVLGLYKKYQHY